MEELFFEPIHPGEILLEEFLKPLNISQHKLALRMGESPQKINDIVRGKRGITAKTAVGLAKVFDTTARFWMNLQTQFDLDSEFIDSGFTELDSEVDKNFEIGLFEKQVQEPFEKYTCSNITQQEPKLSLINKNVEKLDSFETKMKKGDSGLDPTYLHEPVTNHVERYKEKIKAISVLLDLNLEPELDPEPAVAREFEKSLINIFETKDQNSFTVFLNHIYNLGKENQIIFSLANVIKSIWENSYRKQSEDMQFEIPQEKKSIFDVKSHNYARY